ncbi:asparagine-tRNA ligase [Exophiala spinifera]|uniref:asparagine--tRNA ligase n=1 Tax=Exophiala spinifera TaxID=91928 RepID=A0A0D2BHM6_9EURO|nr:asparagine-tRNA ligase [Exophiala spinifera]KIW10874.1 asparagine-tRNA ligase [Exophiala spinifera]
MRAAKLLRKSHLQLCPRISPVQVESGMLWRFEKSPCISRSLRCLQRHSLEPKAIRHSFHHTRPVRAEKNDGTSSALRAVRHATLVDSSRLYDAASRNAIVKVVGLVRSVRKQKNVAFARVADGSTLGSVQAVFPHPNIAKDITNGAYVSLIGKWVASQGAGQSHELLVHEIETIGESNPLENPIQKQSMTAEFLRTVPHLRMRTAFQSLLVRVRSQLTAAVSAHFNNRSEPVYQVHPPLITSSDCEGAGEVFTITPRSKELPRFIPPSKSKEQEKLYFREPKYLTVSSQLHLEAYSAQLGDVFALSPTFRAEESDTPRHLAEFYMLEAEHRHIAFDDLLASVRSLIVDLTQSLQAHKTGKELLQYYEDHKHRPDDVDFVDLEERWSRLTGPWHTVTYTAAIDALEKAHEASSRTLFVNRPQWEWGLQLEHERWIVENIAEGKPVFVTHYPKAIKPFYMLPSAVISSSGQHSAPADNYTEHQETVACFDLLLPYGYCEVVGGSLREHRLKELIHNMRSKGLIKNAEEAINRTDYPFLEPGESLGALKWYADLRRFGSNPHGGYGLGFDRLLAYLTGVANVRDVVGFPRTWGRADC